MNWIIFSNAKQDCIWSHVNKLINWKPGSRFHHIIPPDPYRVFDISCGKSSIAGHDDVMRVLNDLETTILKAFQACTEKQDVIYALDGQDIPLALIKQYLTMNLVIGLFLYFQTETIISFFISIFFGGFWVIRGNVQSLYLVKNY